MQDDGFGIVVAAGASFETVEFALCLASEMRPHMFDAVYVMKIPMRELPIFDDGQNLEFCI